MQNLHQLRSPETIASVSRGETVRGVKRPLNVKKNIMEEKLGARKMIDTRDEGIMKKRDRSECGGRQKTG